MRTGAFVQQTESEHAGANRSGRHSNGATSAFADSRPEGVAQRRLQSIADNSAQVRQLESRGGMGRAVANMPHGRTLQAVQHRTRSPEPLDRAASVQHIQAPAQVQEAGVPAQRKNDDARGTVQFDKKGIGIGAAIGGAVGALGFLGGPALGAVTTSLGALAGGAIGGYVTKGPDDFAKHAPNKDIDPDEIGEENGGIRVVDEEGARPDDVPLVPAYRIAMHRLHDVVLVLESADRSGEKDPPSPDTAKLRKKMVEVQKEGKNLAKHHKSAMRNLTSDESVDDLKQEYIEGMNLLTQQLLNHTMEGDSVIKKHNYLNNGATLKDTGTSIWRTKWLAVKTAVDTALTSLWGSWRSSLKTKAKTNVSENMEQGAWGRQVDAEKWGIYYGGSLAKGYKGPPKQNTRFLESEFDVDANMDAPAIARYLINDKHNTVDRGQLSPKNAPETGVNDMDDAMDKEVKKELIKVGAAPNEAAVDKIVSEKFETRINAPEDLGGGAADEVQRSIDEQTVRDTLTGLRHTNLDDLAQIHEELAEEGLCENGSLVARVLTAEEIQTVRDAIERVTG